MKPRALLFFSALCACGGSEVPAAPGDAGPGPADARSDAPAVTWCSSSRATFCGDFDDPLVPFRGWDGIAVTRPGTFATTDAAPETTSKPKMGRGSLAAIAQGANVGHAEVKKTLALGGKKRLTIDMALAVGDAQPTGDAIVRVLALDVGRGSIGLFRDATKWFVSVYRENAAGPSATEPALSSPFPTGRFTKTKLEVVLGNPEGRLRLEVDGASLVDQAIATHGDAQTLADVALVVGPSHVRGTTAAFDVRLDDVTIVLGPD